MFCGSFYFCNFLNKCVCRDGSEIEFTVEQHNHTFYVGKFALCCGKVSCKLGLFFGVEHAFGRRYTEIRGLSACAELVIAVVFVNIADSNVLDCDKSMQFCSQFCIFKISCFVEDGRDVFKHNVFGIIDDLCGCVFDFMRTVVNVFDTRDFNNHTKFDAESFRIFFHGVDVVAAVCVIHIQLVILVACRFRADGGNSAANSDGYFFFCRNVFCIGQK